MKNLTQYIPVFLMLVLFTTTLTAAQKGTVKNNYNNTTIEANYLEALNSDNKGLRVSSAYFLGEIKSEKAVNSLIKMLRSSDSKAERTMAALSLVKIGNKKGLYMVKREAIFNDFEQVRKMCDTFYTATIVNSNNN